MQIHSKLNSAKSRTEPPVFGPADHLEIRLWDSALAKMTTNDELVKMMILSARERREAKNGHAGSMADGKTRSDTCSLQYQHTLTISQCLVTNVTKTDSSEEMIDAQRILMVKKLHRGVEATQLLHEGSVPIEISK